MKSIMTQVGWAGAILFNERTGRIIDGHMRQELSDPDQLVPVLVGDWSEEQEQLILMSHDPIASLAEIEANQLKQLLASITVADDSVRDLYEMMEEKLRSISTEIPEFEPVEQESKPEKRCPNCGAVLP